MGLQKPEFWGEGSPPIPFNLRHTVYIWHKETCISTSNVSFQTEKRQEGLLSELTGRALEED